MDALLAQFGDVKAPAAGPTTAIPVPVKTTPLDWTLDTVFQGGHADMGKNSANTVLTLVKSLAQFPEPQRLAMVRAIDAADDTWDEAHVLADARLRVAILAKYLTLIDGDVQGRTAAVEASFNEAKAGTDGQIADLDRQIEALKAQREELAHGTTAARTAADEQVRQIQAQADAKRQEAQAAKGEYEALVKFFGQP